jgi:hypothetical protein
MDGHFCPVQALADSNSNQDVLVQASIYGCIAALNEVVQESV